MDARTLRFLVVAVLLGAGCQESDAVTGPSEPESSEPESSEPGPSEPEPAAEAEVAPGDEARTEAPHFFFPEGCWDARADTREAALTRCRELRDAGPARIRSLCRCEPADLIEVRSSDPIAYYFHPGCWVRGPTVEAVREACPARREELAEAEAPGGEPELACTCDPPDIVAVRGPYERHRFLGEFNDPARYRYLSPNGEWLDEVGDPVCFAAGTPILTPDGARAIESLRAGERVLSFDIRKERYVVGTVRRVHERRAPFVGIVRASGRELVVTANHPFFLAREREWRPASTLEAGDLLLAFDDHEGPRSLPVTLPVTEVVFDARTGPRDVFNLSVDGEHNYFADGVLVHNY